MTSQLCLCNDHVQGNIHQSHHQNLCNRNYQQRCDNFNKRRTNYDYHRYQQQQLQQSSQRSMQRNSSDNLNYLNGDPVLNWLADESINAKNSTRHSPTTNLLFDIAGKYATEATIPHNQIDDCVDELNNYAYNYAMN
ncbi:unnamed protein product [Adineta steineri]|uniref:Uncharacterized protein n=1 Tax=Adineta steineri TaxID=433720 RepID=A0A815JS23_9BILA|nr:unnamed protein product [Adineta steineri]CAF4124615.1 unnamed protein product [Adineta steineri]